ncbi:MAG: hypothetical protein WCP21_21440, partial [Armatimonadota bacterium]
DAATVYPETEAIRKLRGMTAESRYLAVNDRRIWGLAAVPAGVVLPPNAGTVYGLRCVDGYDSLFPLAYRQYAAELEGADPSPLANGNMLLLGDWPAWTNSAVTVSVFAADDSPPKGSMDSTIEGTVLSAFALGSPRSAVRFSVPTQGWAGRTSHRDVLFGRRARVDDLNHVRVGIKSPYGVQPPSGLKSGAELWQADTFYPGWRCYVDGAERVLGTYAGTPGKTAVFRRVALQPHDRVADFVYYPASVAAGLFVTLLALAALTALGTSALWRHRA